MKMWIVLYHDGWEFNIPKGLFFDYHSAKSFVEDETKDYPDWYTWNNNVKGYHMIAPVEIKT